jgi:hypothetical protein
MSSWEVGLFWLEKWNTPPKPLLRFWVLTLEDVAHPRDVRVESFSDESVVFREEVSESIETLELNGADFSYVKAGDDGVPAPEELKLGFSRCLKIEFPPPDGRLYVVGELVS